MKIVFHIPEQLQIRLEIQRKRNGLKSAEIIRQAMIEHFDRLDTWHTPGNAESREFKLEPGQTGGFGIQTVWSGENK